MARSRYTKPTFVAPEQPPKTEAELAFQQKMAQQLNELSARLHQENLDNAVLLARQAARGQGPLVEHFAELGRRYVEWLDEPQKPQLRVIKGAPT